MTFKNELYCLMNGAQGWGLGRRDLWHIRKDRVHGGRSAWDSLTSMGSRSRRHSSG